MISKIQFECRAIEKHNATISSYFRRKYHDDLTEVSISNHIGEGYSEICHDDLTEVSISNHIGGGYSEIKHLFKEFICVEPGQGIQKIIYLNSKLLKY